MPAIRFEFRPKKTVQAAAFLLKQQENHRMTRMRLLKLLYIADRESLKETGYPITGDCGCAMGKGTIVSTVYDMIKGSDDHSELWRQFIKTGEFPRSYYEERLVEDPGDGELSQYEMNKLADVFSEYKDKTDRELSALTHKFPEYMRNRPHMGSSNHIPLEHILEAVGRSHDIDIVQQNAREDVYFNTLFGEEHTC